MSSSQPHMAAEVLRANHHGDALLTRQLGSVRLTDQRYLPCTRLESHFHERASLYFVRCGEFEEKLSQRVLKLSGGNLWFRPAGELHENRFGNRGARCLVMDLTDGWLRHVRSYAAFPDEPLLRVDNEVLWLGTRLCQEFSLQETPSSLAIEGLLLELAACLSRSGRIRSSNGAIPPWLGKVLEILHAHYTDQMHLSRLAALVEVHPVHLARVFRKHYGCTVGEYVQRLRIEFACKRLRLADSSISAIALDAGFANQAHLSRVFKLVTGISPAQYRAISAQHWSHPFHCERLHN